MDNQLVVVDEIDDPDVDEIDDPPIQAMIAAPPAVAGVPMMDAAEARQIVKNINRRLEESRKDLIELHDREGWKALGYDNWRSCVETEFQQSAAYLYRQMAAGKIEQLIDSPIGEIPESHLRPLAKAKVNTQEAIKRTLDRADQLAGDQPRTAKHIEQAVQEIAQPDLPIDFSIVQRRLAAHGVTLSYKDGMFVTHTAGKSVGIATPTWSNVTDRLSLFEDGMDDAYTPAAAAEQTSEQPEARPAAAPRPASATVAAYDDKEAADLALIADAENAIAHGETDLARVLLDQVEVAIYRRDQVLATITASYGATESDIRAAARAFAREQRARLKKFSQSGMISQTTFGQALDHIEALLAE